MAEIIRKNVILITIDSLRKDHCSCYGYWRKTTPFLDSLAESGIKFNYTFSNGPLTPRAFPSILCGATTFEGKVNDIQSNFLPKNLITIAQKLQKKGYYCAAFQSGNPFISRFYGYDRGFNEFLDYLPYSSNLTRKESNKDKLKKYLKSFIKRRKWLERRIRLLIMKKEYFKRLKQIKSDDLPFIRGIKINKDINFWLRNYNKHKPLFLWIHYMDVHQPHFPQEDIRKKLGVKKYSIHKLAKYWAEINNRIINNKEQIRELIDLYDCEIRYEDECLKNLFNIFKNNNIHKYNSSFIITSDHGDEFGEHGGLGHELKLYNEMLKVPLIIYGKDVKNYSYVSNELIELKSIPDLILSFANSQFEYEFGKEFIISESLRENNKFSGYVRLISIQNKEYKFIYDCGNQINNEFYSLSYDENEQKNLIRDPQFKKMINVLKKKIENYLDRSRITKEYTPLSSSEKLKENEIIKERIKSLGYME